MELFAAFVFALIGIVYAIEIRNDKKNVPVLTKIVVTDKKKLNKR